MEGLNKKIVCDFYKELAARETEMVHRLLAPDIDWWFHGPPAHKYNLMQVLTGTHDFDANDSYEPLCCCQSWVDNGSGGLPHS